MKTIPGGMFLLTACLMFGGTAPVYAGDVENGFSIIFGGKTLGDHEALSREAAVFRREKDSRSLVIGFGSLLGPTPIVKHDIADQFLRTARDAGFDYIIPAAPEFMFGTSVLRRIAKNTGYPGIISANIVGRKSREPVFKPYVIWEVDGKRVCVIAFSDSGVLRDSRPQDVAGIDVVSCEEALANVTDSVAAEEADFVVAAGPISGRDIVLLAREYPYIDVFLTTIRPGGNRGPSTMSLAGKTIFVCAETENELGMFSFRERSGIESREYAALDFGRALPPDERILSSLTRTIDEFKRREIEEQNLMNTGSAVAAVLKEAFTADAAFIERQCVSPLPLDGGLTIANVRSAIRPGTKLAVYSLTGAAIRSISRESMTRCDPAARLITAGITPDGRIGSLPVDTTAVYTVVTTLHLRQGGNGYAKFGEGTNERVSGVEALNAAARFLTARDARLRRAARHRNWGLVMNLSVGSNFNKQDVDDEKARYGSSLPTQFKSLKDQFFGYVRFGSEGNSFAYKKNRHALSLKLNAVYQRTGTRPDSGKVVYTKSSDFARLDGRYEYDVVTFGSRPYMDMTVNSILYSGEGRHPLGVNVSTGLTRKIPRIWLDTSLGINGTRNYATNMNSVGTKVTLAFKRVLPPKAPFSGQTTLTSDTEVFWTPTAQAKNEFRHENHNRMRIQLLRKLDLIMGIHTYSFRNSAYHRTAVGIHYDLNLTYGMQWKV